MRFAAALLCLAAGLAHAQGPAATLGKQRAAVSPIEWEIREANHPLLGPIRFAVMKRPIAVPVGSSRIFARAYFSCEKGARKLAIELSNQAALDDPSGLAPKAMPRLVCHRPGPGGKIVDEDLEARWHANDIGDVLARGLRAFALRECASIDVVEEVALPTGWPQPTARVRFELTPYNRELDEIFVTCGEKSAYDRSARAAPQASTTPSTAPQATAAPDAAPGGEQWKTVRTTSRGRTNVRAKPSVDAAVVVMLYPGDVILVQLAGNGWWRAKARPGSAPFEGYIRQDRLIFK